MESIRFYFTNRRIIYIMGILKDKEAEKIVRLTCGLPAAVITTSDSANPGLTPPVELAELVRGYCENVTAADSPPGSSGAFQASGREDGVVVAFGSLSFQGKIIRAITESMGGSDGKRKKN